MPNLLQHPRLQNQINSLWESLSHIDIYCVDLERAMKTLLDMKNDLPSKLRNLEEDCYEEDMFTIPTAILISSLQVKKLATQRRIQTLLANIAGSQETESPSEEEDTEFSDLFSRVKILLTSIKEYIKNKRGQNERESESSVLQANVCNMICKSPSNLCFKNGRWQKRIGGIDSDDPKCDYVVALHRRLRKQCQNIVLLQKERNALLLENDLLREDLEECQCNKRIQRACK